MVGFFSDFDFDSEWHMWHYHDTHDAQSHDMKACAPNGCIACDSFDFLCPFPWWIWWHVPREPRPHNVYWSWWTQRCGHMAYWVCGFSPCISLPGHFHFQIEIDWTSVNFRSLQDAAGIVGERWESVRSSNPFLLIVCSSRGCVFDRLVRSRLSPASRVSQNSSRVDSLREFERYHLNSFDIIHNIWYMVYRHNMYIYIYIIWCKHAGSRTVSEMITWSIPSLITSFTSTM